MHVCGSARRVPPLLCHLTALSSPSRLLFWLRVSPSPPPPPPPPPTPSSYRSALEETTGMAAVRVKLASTTMSRIDKVMEKIRGVKTEVTASTNSMEQEQA